MKPNSYYAPETDQPPYYSLLKENDEIVIETCKLRNERNAWACFGIAMFLINLGYVAHVHWGW